MPEPLVRQTAAPCDYGETWTAMRRFVAAAAAGTPEELWLLQHAPVYTLGRAGNPAHLIKAGDIPVVRSDRGGQITYHGPGQIIAYTLLDMRRRAFGLRALVRRLEAAVVALLAAHGIAGAGDAKAPGVYVNGAKIAALGLRMRRGWIYHGLALNVCMDLRPFENINPCGFAGMKVTQMSDFGVTMRAEELMPALAARLREHLF